ncbi:hypothetical protein BDB00DRAFT_868086 [Zychaea mexicana]|uniref:uncharacterized protein n=1 Tax=Zychaea mexicana TaxID=64656 RepID=UPI0022FF2484|nr:uncharacterized protein BDB00DRAFT_868086 [Zychaea mexicana]KAI9497952.1 hypothetical protein BDB00DRAFT_868086 [Zychaea mexicana]
MAPSSNDEKISPLPPEGAMTQQRRQQTTPIAQPVPRSKPIAVPSSLWPRNQHVGEGQSPSSFELLQQHVDHLTQQRNNCEGKTKTSSWLSSDDSSSSDNDDNNDIKDSERGEEDSVECTITPRPDDHPSKSILIHRRPSSLPTSCAATQPRGMPLLDATTIPRPQTVHFSNDPPQVHRYPPSQQQQDNPSVEKANLFLPWPDDVDEDYRAKQQEQERAKQEELAKINDAWK